MNSHHDIPAGTLSSLAATSRRQLFVASVAIALSVASLGQAHTTPVLSIEELALLSGTIAVGAIVEARAFDAGPAGQPGIHTRIRLRVEQSIAGTDEPMLTFWVQGGELGDRLRVVTGQAQFVAGERVLVFLFDGGGDLWPTAMAQGKLVVADPEHLWTAPAEDRIRLSSGGAQPPLVDLVARIRAARGDR